MADPVTIHLDPETVERLQKLASEQGETLEARAQRVLEAEPADAADTLHSPEQIEDLKRRMANPGPIATEEEAEAFFARFRD